MSLLGVPEPSLVDVVGAVLPMITEDDVRKRFAAIVSGPAEL